METLKDSLLEDVEFFLGPDRAARLRSTRDGALRYLGNAQKGRLDSIDRAWAERHLAPGQAEYAAKRADMTRHAETAKNSRPRVLATAASAGSLKSASLGSAAAARGFDGSAARRGGPGDRPDPAAVSNRWDTRKVLGLKETSEHEKAQAFSREWNKRLEARMKKNPVGQDILARLDGKLPEVYVVDFPPNSRAGAGHASRTGRILLNAKVVAEEANHHRSFSDPKGLVLPNQAPAIREALMRDPRLMDQVLDTLEPTMAHELTHAAQARAFGLGQVRGKTLEGTVDMEREAFLVGVQYTQNKAREDRMVMLGGSPMARHDRQMLHSYADDPDAFLRDVDARYPTLPEAKDLRKEVRKYNEDPAVPELFKDKGPREERAIAGMEKHYPSLVKNAREEWRGKSVETQLLLAEDAAQFQKDRPEVALDRLRLAQKRDAAEVDRILRESPGRFSHLLRLLDPKP